MDISGYVKQHGFYTNGEFRDEDEGKQILDSFLSASIAICAHSEVPGFILQPRLRVDQKKCRADRLLVPTPTLVESGWNKGVILIECKAPNKPLGPAACQCMDYLRCGFTLASGITVIPEHAFIWHSGFITNDFASVCENGRIGNCCIYDGSLRFSILMNNIMDLHPDGSFTFFGNPKAGNKAGSR